MPPKFRLFRTYRCLNVGQRLKKGLNEISYEKVNDKYNKFTGAIVENKKQIGETLILAVKSENKTAVGPICD
jgi:hypothetical protein